MNLIIIQKKYFHVLLIVNIVMIYILKILILRIIGFLNDIMITYNKYIYDFNYLDYKFLQTLPEEYEKEFRQNKNGIF